MYQKQFESVNGDYLVHHDGRFLPNTIEKYSKMNIYFLLCKQRELVKLLKDKNDGRFRVFDESGRF